MSLQEIILPSVWELAPYSSARDEYSGTEGIFLDANENPYDFDYARYPDPYQSKLKEKVSSLKGIDTKSIFIGNGSDEVIDNLIRITCQPNTDRILSLDPSYGMYKVSAAIHRIAIDLAPMTDALTPDVPTLLQMISEEHKLIFICSPNNPNGDIIPSSVIEDVLQKAKGLVVIDEAYIDFADEESWIKKLATHPNLVIMQTLSKAWAAAGLRIGLAFAAPDLIAIMNKVKPPYNVSTITQTLAIKRLERSQSVNESVARIKEERERLKRELKQIALVDRIFPSQANFLLVRFGSFEKVKTSLLENKIIVRDRSSQNYCERCLRITIGTRDQNDQLLTILKSI